MSGLWEAYERAKNREIQAVRKKKRKELLRWLIPVIIGAIGATFAALRYFK